MQQILLFSWSLFFSSSHRWWTMLVTRRHVGWQASGPGPSISSRWGAIQWASMAPERPASGVTGATLRLPLHQAVVSTMDARWIIAEILIQEYMNKAMSVSFGHLIQNPLSFSRHSLSLASKMLPKHLWCPQILTIRLFLILDLSSPIKVRKTMSFIPISTSWTSRSKPHVTQNKANINRLDTLIEISQQRIRGNCKEPRGHLIDFGGRLQRLIKLKSWLSVHNTHRAYKAWVEAGFGARGADNDLHWSCGIYSPEGGSRLCCLS